MSDAYKGLEDLRVNPYVSPQKTAKAVADFNCPICGERIQMMFTKEDLKQLMKGIDIALARGRPSP